MVDKFSFWEDAFNEWRKSHNIYKRIIYWIVTTIVLIIVLTLCVYIILVGIGCNFSTTEDPANICYGFHNF